MRGYLICKIINGQDQSKSGSFGDLIVRKMEEGTANTNILTALNLFPNPAKSMETSSNTQPARTSGKTIFIQGVDYFSLFLYRA